MRDTKEVLEDHLKLSKEGNIKEDLERNFSKDVKFLTTNGTYRGHEGAKELPHSQFDY